ncbi:tetratricopeptide repeat protein [Paraburkholderia sp. LEh10]|uniref:tetratricopeptide repeat protein n=1 Tax=Paraburkholderia sp. LEh10 TaxID=2821353 RepID=UPI001AE8A184|nr:tetratricopeptide repeat protein [Paraburkholderia sp. LEh10]MBP0589865.1 tetratricopeptide repeat protein [Paraburkholderia sp. LEh10]
MKKLLAAAGLSLTLSLMLAPGAAFAVPTATQIETTIQQGNWQKADSQLNEVLKAHPDSARAHYLYAQVLDREGRPSEALAQLQQAKTLDPQVRFTDPDRFAQTEARLRADAARVGGGAAGGLSTNSTHRTNNPFAQQEAGPATSALQQAPQRHGPSMGMWIGIAVLIAAIALILRWTLRRARSQEDTRAGDDRRIQLKRATDLLNEVRSLKLDVKLSTAPGHEALEREVEGAETQLRQLVEALSNSKNPVPPYQIEEIERQVASLKARAEGRPDPNAAPAAAAGTGGESAYAREANEAFGRGQQQAYPPGYPPGYAPQAPYPYPPQQQQPPVVVQQGGGFGAGMGGLLTGVLLGEALNSGRERVIERDVIVDDEARKRSTNDPGSVDFGQGSNDWSDGGGDVDMGSDDSGGWNDT